MVETQSNDNSNNEEGILLNENNNTNNKVINKQPNKLGSEKVNTKQTTSNQDKKQPLTGFEFDEPCRECFPLTCFLFDCSYYAANRSNEESKFKFSKAGIPCLPCDFVISTIFCPLLFCGAKLGKL